MLGILPAMSPVISLETELSRGAKRWTVGKLSVDLTVWAIDHHSQGITVIYRRLVCQNRCEIGGKSHIFLWFDLQHTYSWDCLVSMVLFLAFIYMYVCMYVM